MSFWCTHALFYFCFVGYISFFSQAAELIDNIRLLPAGEPSNAIEGATRIGVGQSLLHTSHHFQNASFTIHKQKRTNPPSISSFLLLFRLLLPLGTFLKLCISLHLSCSLGELPAWFLRACIFVGGGGGGVGDLAQGCHQNRARTNRHGGDLKGNKGREWARSVTENGGHTLKKMSASVVTWGVE